MDISNSLKKLKNKASEASKYKKEIKIPVAKSININSLWVFHYDGSGCDSCNAEYLACLGPAWDIERLGIRNTGNPAYADVLLVTGLIDKNNKLELLDIYNQTREECKVVALGACACTGGMFSGCGDVLEGVDHIIPVDLYVAGCATRPQGIIDALLMIKDSMKQRGESDEQ